jgi:hypothetical protein
MNAILHIGYNRFAFKDIKKALAAMAALSEGMEVDHDFDPDLGGEVYRPPERPSKVSVESVPEITLFRKPTKAPTARVVKQLEFNGKVHYQ